MGGYIDTVADNIPAGFRPTGGLPVTFTVGSAVTPGLSYTGYIDNQGRIQFAASENVPVGVGTFATLPAHVTYTVGPLPAVTVKNFQISNGPSNAAKWNPKDFPSDDPAVGGEKSIGFDFGDYNDPQKGFFNGTYYTTWADNSAELPGNTPNQAYRSYALAKIKVNGFGKTFTRERIVNLSRTRGGVTLSRDFSYEEGGVTVDPTDERNLAVTYQQRKKGSIGFVLSLSSDGGDTWTKKLIGVPDPTNPNQPLDPNLPTGGTDIHSGFDRFGGLWITYLADTILDGNTIITPAHLHLVYSADKGKTFDLIESIPAASASEMPEGQPYGGLDYDYLGMGPDATNLSYGTVWMSMGDALRTAAPNEWRQRVYGLRVKGLGVANIDRASFKEYVLPGSNQAGFGSIDVDPKGRVFVALMQTNPTGTYLEQLRDNTRSWVNVLEHGLADDSFSNPRQFALTAIGDVTLVPPQPHANFLRPGTNMIAVDKSTQHPGRLYAVYSNRPNINSATIRPYLTWSDDEGMTWSNPITVSDDPSPATAILPAVSVDPITGVVAVEWQDARGSATNEDVNEYGVFLDPRELK